MLLPGTRRRPWKPSRQLLITAAAELLKGVDSRTDTLEKTELATECTRRSEAERLQSAAEDVTAKAAALIDAAKKLSDDVIAFQTETKRAAEEEAAKKAAEARAKEAEEAKAAEEAAAAEACCRGRAAAVVTAVAPQYRGGYRLDAPQGPGHTTYVPAPVPYVPPAPAAYVACYWTRSRRRWLDATSARYRRWRWLHTNRG